MTMSASTPPGTWSRTGPPTSARSFATTVPKAGLAAKVHGRTVFEIATDVLRLARAGLARRKHFDIGGEDEGRYLDILDDRLARGTTPAQELLEKFHGPWAGSVDPIYAEESY